MSISVALAMTYAGADHATKAQMESVLFQDRLRDDRVHKSFAKLVRLLNPRSKHYTLSTANRLYADRRMKFKKEFLDTCRNDYHSSLAKVNFGHSEKVRGEINHWVEKKTKNKIKDLIGQGVLDANTRLVLVNAIYFKGDWKYKFKKRDTRPAFFYHSPGKRSKVPTMHQDAKHKYTENAEVKVMGMRYKNSDLAMYIFLPKKRFGLEAWLKKTDGGKISKLIKRCRPTKLKVSLPKWKQDSSFELKGQLEKLGMPDAFDERKADFGKMTADAKLVISHVIHKAFIEVNEEGSEAAAATAVVSNLRSAGANRKTPFVADHPFLYAIFSGPHCLFAGTMN